MSLMKSLARVAAGVMLAKGIGAVMQSRSKGQASPQSRTAGSQSGGGLLGEIFGDNTGGSGGSLRDQLGKVLGGNKGSGTRYGGPNSKGAQGGLGGILDSLTGAGGSGGGLNDVLGKITGNRGGSTTGGGGLGDMLGGLLGGATAGGAVAGGLAQKGSQPKNDASFGELFNDAVARDGEPEVAPTPEQNAVAGLMLKAMIQAAKADGRIDDAEKQRLMGNFGDEISDEERDFIREQMAAPVDPGALARDVPKGLEAQVYLMSLLAIDFDSKEEARYLQNLAQEMGLSDDVVNAVHAKAGAAPISAA